MKRIDNWEQVEAFNGDKETLEPGGYICEIMEAKETTYYNNNGEAFQRLQVSFDIVEGPRAGHFARDYRTQAVYGKQNGMEFSGYFPRWKEAATKRSCLRDASRQLQTH